MKTIKYSKKYDFFSKNKLIILYVPKRNIFENVNLYSEIMSV